MLKICPHCSKHRKKNYLKTLKIYPETGSFFCHHCKRHGTLENLDVDITIERKHHEVRKHWNGKTNRFSTVKPKHSNETQEYFGIKSPAGQIVGYHERGEYKFSRTTNERLFGYSEDYLQLNKTYRIVEGPYDCIYNNDICVFGYPSKKQAKLLKYYSLILCPDGDVWKTKETLVNWICPFLWNDVKYVERLPNEKDPDEVHMNERTILDWKDVKKWVWKNKQ